MFNIPRKLRTHLSLLTIVTISAITSEYTLAQPLDNKAIKDFCENKSLWAFFSIDPNQCQQAARACAQEKRFADIDPSTLSEEFYNCVFKALGIEVD
jgi:hypothetical protein